MSARHLIEQLDFDIEFDTAAPDLQDDGYLTALLRETLLPVVDEVLEACDEPGTVLTLPSLALDLGVIPRDVLCQEAATRLRAVLRDAIDAARVETKTRTQTQAPAWAFMSGAPGGPSVAGMHRSRAESEVEQLAGFLATGRLPWHAPLRRCHQHVELLDRLLEHGGARLLELLPMIVSHPAALRRLAAQFPVRQLHALAQLAAPAPAHRASSTGHPASSAVRSAPGLSAPVFSATAWAAAIEALQEFLRTGRLHPVRLAPGLAGGAGERVHEYLLARALQGQPERLRAALCAALSQPGATRRAGRAVSV